MDYIEPLFPIPLMRCQGVLPAEIVAEAAAAIRDAKIEQNLRSDQLFHTEVANPLERPIFRKLAEFATPKMEEFGMLLFGDKLRWNHAAAFGCLVAGAFFMFHKF